MHLRDGVALAIRRSELGGLQDLDGRSLSAAAAGHVLVCGRRKDENGSVVRVTKRTVEARSVHKANEDK